MIEAVTDVPQYPAGTYNWYKLPRSARLTDLYLGGRQACDADREFLQAMYERLNWRPPLRAVARINRWHTIRVAETFNALGHRQFLDLGCGMPTPEYAKIPFLHEAVGPDARVMYVDSDLYVVGAGRATMAGPPGHPVFLLADLRRLETLLSSAQLNRHLDLDRPVIVLLRDVLPWIGEDSEVAEAMEILRENLAPGSALSVTHATDLGRVQMSRLSAVYEQAGMTFRPRDPEFIRTLFGNWPLQDPGLVPTSRWHPIHPHTGRGADLSGALAGVAVKPPAPTTLWPSQQSGAKPESVALNSSERGAC